MLWDTCKTVSCLFGPLCIHFQIPINGCLFSRSRSTFPSLSSFTAGRRLSASIVALYKIVACTTCIIFLTRHAVSLARCEVFWFFSRRIILRSGRFVWWLVCFFSVILPQRLCWERQRTHPISFFGRTPGNAWDRTLIITRRESALCPSSL